MDGLPIKRTAAKPHACYKCNTAIKAGKQFYSLPQRVAYTKKFVTLYLCSACGLKQIAKLLDKARREMAMIEAAK